MGGVGLALHTNISSKGPCPGAQGLAPPGGALVGGKPVSLARGADSIGCGSQPVTTYRVPSPHAAQRESLLGKLGAWIFIFIYLFFFSGGDFCPEEGLGTLSRVP